VAFKVLQLLFRTPYVSVDAVAQAAERTYANANQLVKRMQALGIVRELTGKQRGRRYGNDALLKFIDI
ncbi:MAG: Fic family protein, partial [Candidatus Latescibacterota bacterium]|nr:Fic family protein [Candidatus Latescibacterota bacterium]